MPLFRHRKPAGEVAPVELVTPQATIDGWTLDGTALAGSVRDRQLQRELCTLLHGIAVRVDTPWTYERAAAILDEAGEPAQAHAVCEAWLRRPASRESTNSQATRHLTRLRDRLRSRLAGPAAAS
jgi:hypothetical protein